MAKGQLTRSELEERQQCLISEIEKLEAVIKASDTTTFEIIIEDIKREMSGNVAEEEWKILKQNIAKVDKFREIVRIIQNQDDLLEQKKDELKDVEWELDHYQMSVFENHTVSLEGDCVSTEYKHVEGYKLETGDVYKAINHDGEVCYCLVKKSSEKAGAYALISNSFQGELLLNYPKNRKLVVNAEYVGNIYLSKAEQGEIEQKNALAALKIIGDSALSNNGDTVDG